jgi:hypothetical protein
MQAAQAPLGDHTSGVVPDSSRARAMGINSTNRDNTPLKVRHLMNNAGQYGQHEHT